MKTASVNLKREFDKCESHATIKIEVNSDDLLEVEDITRAAVAADYPGWEFNYLRTT